jgi:hypothetical protein
VIDDWIVCSIVCEYEKQQRQFASQKVFIARQYKKRRVIRSFTFPFSRETDSFFLLYGERKEGRKEADREDILTVFESRDTDPFSC